MKILVVNELNNNDSRVFIKESEIKPLVTHEVVELDYGNFSEATKHTNNEED